MSGKPTDDENGAPLDSATMSQTHGQFIGLERLGDFDIIREIGRGSMGVVFEATQRSLGRRVALKVLYTEGKSDKAIERFRREAGAAARLNHPGIVPVWAIGEEHGVLYYAMQLVEGPTLRELIYGQKPIDPARAALIARRMAQALAYAHREGIVHRDIKPANVIITTGDQPVITDFGLAKVLALKQLTQAGAVLGTPTHMSPEQARGELGIDHRADIYALGVCLYEMLTRRLPFEAKRLDDLIRKILRDKPPRPRKYNPSIPKALEAITMRCLAKARADRYASAEELVADLDRFLRGEPVEAERHGVLATLGRHRAARIAMTAGSLVLAVALGWAAHAFWYERTEAQPHAAIGGMETGTQNEQRPVRERSSGGDAALERHAARERWLREAKQALGDLERARGAERIVTEERALDAFSRALAFDPASAGARLGRARIFANRAKRADLNKDRAAAQAYRSLVRELDTDGVFKDLFVRDGTLRVATRPVAATLTLERQELDPSTLTFRSAVIEERLSTPLGPKRLEAGSYLLTLEAPGFAPLRCSVEVLAGRETVLELRLLRPDEIPPGFVYVPAGPFRFGGDPKALRAGAARRVDLKGFLIAEREVTVSEYAAFLNALSKEQARAFLPRGTAKQGYATLFWPLPDGGWGYPPAWSPERPVSGVSFEAARAYARWAAERLERPIRLPSEFEWEKAGRGGDGRPYPWGEASPLGRARIPSGEKASAPAPVATHLGDVSVYGVYDLVGNVREWTASRYDPDGALPHRVVRGGGFLPLPDPPRLAARWAYWPEQAPADVGLRLACDLPPE